MFLRSILFSSAITCALASAGCSKKTDSHESAGHSQSSVQSGAHAPADAVPGSHEDWCAEHAVPESQCTLCNPALAAAFKATGDWCADHGLPKSHCRKCDPNLSIVRPPKAN